MAVDHGLNNVYSRKQLLMLAVYKIGKAQININEENRYKIFNTDISILSMFLSHYLSPISLAYVTTKYVYEDTTCICVSV